MSPPAFIKKKLQWIEDNYNTSINIDHIFVPVIHPLTGETVYKYQKPAKDPTTKEIWTAEFGKEFGNLAQDDNKMKTKGTDYIFFMERHEIKNNPKDRTITSSRVVVNLRPQKEDPN